MGELFDDDDEERAPFDEFNRSDDAMLDGIKQAVEELEYPNRYHVAVTMTRGSSVTGRSRMQARCFAVNAGTADEADAAYKALKELADELAG